jgi:cobalamin biosynthesis Mg chelatase CobN
MVGKWFCAKQILQTSSGLKSSPVVYRKVLASSVAASPLPSLRVIPSPLPSLRVIPSPLARPSVSSSSNVVQPTVSATSGPGDKSSASLSESLAQSDNSTTTDKESSLVSSGINVLEKAQDSNSSSLNMLIVILGSVIVIILITLIIIFSKRKQ